MAMNENRKARLRANAEKSARQQYVRDASVRGSLVAPFLDAHLDVVAHEYIETGDETLKAQLPAPRATSPR
jgi:hypothetical protein